MHRSIAGLTDALQSIEEAKVSLQLKSKNLGFKGKYDVRSIEDDLESSKRLSEAGKFYLDMESCTARIAARLREIDNIDLKSGPNEDGATKMSNQQRFINDQCLRAETLLSTEYYMNKLHTEDVNKEISELDERIAYNAKNWKHALTEMGINETEGQVVHSMGLRSIQSDLKKVHRNSVLANATKNLSTTESSYELYDSLELEELNKILSKFMDNIFLNGTNGSQLTSKSD